MKTPIERIYIDLDELEKMERDILTRRHIERYAMVRQWCKGVLLDFACGCGYGTYLVSKNPDVSKVIGIDITEDAIKWADDNFKNPKIEFMCKDVLTFKEDVDVLISLETIEHIKDTSIIPTVSENTKAKELIISYPTKKTTHYNKFHFYDFTKDQIVELFPNYVLLKEINLYEEVQILHFVRK